MKYLALASLAAIAIASAPAAAQDDDGLYVGVGNGLVQSGDVDFTTTGGDVTADPDWGWELEALVGYDLGLVRLEAEAAYKKFDLGALDAGTAGVPASIAADDTPQLVFGPQDGVNGDVAVLTGMVNALADFDAGPVSISVGGGVGMARVDFSDLRNFDTGPGFLDDGDTRFAWQGIAQLRAPLNDRLDASLKYRYLNAGGQELTDSIGRTFEADLNTHSIMGTLIFKLGR